MAEAVLSLVIDSLGTWLKQETKLLRGVRKEVYAIRNELSTIQSVIKDTDEKAENEALNEAARGWVNECREVAYQIEDVIDTYVLHMATEEQYNHCYPKLLGSLERAMCWVFRLRPRHEMAKEIVDVKVQIQAVKEKNQSFGLSSSSSGGGSSRRTDSGHDPRIDSLLIEEVVGIDDQREELISWLVNDGESKRVVISVVGMGGLGKTTLAKKVYDSQKVTDHFGNKAWITVPHPFNAEELLRRTLRGIYDEWKEPPPPQLDTMEESRLSKEIREHLKQKRYLVVFDDVWSVKFWSVICLALPNDSNGSRVLITTRDKDIASKCKESSFDFTHELERLSEDKGLELFCKHAFYGDSLPPNLEELSRNIVRRCEGLPLAIVAIARMLSTKGEKVIEWHEVFKNFDNEWRTNPEFSDTEWILSLSYYDLPHDLRSCLMYFGMFPENMSIRCGRLLRLWIAEGFVKEMPGKPIKKVAEECLKRLINRNLIQVAVVDDDGKFRQVRMHELMRGIMRSMSEKLNYAQVLVDNNNSRDNGFTRRVSIHGRVNDSLLKSNGKFRTRSLSVFDADNLPRTTLQTLMQVSKLLKVLELESAPTDFLPNKVGDLFHLRYLSIRNTKIKELPKSIGKLHNLQTLDLKHSLVHELPVEIKHLCNLLYLIGYQYAHKTDFSVSSHRGLIFQGGLGRLQNLQKLYLIEANHGVELVRKLGKLENLRKLGIIKLAAQDGKILFKSIALMRNLESLEVCSEEGEMLDLQSISSPPQDLQRLDLKGRLEKVPDWIPKLNKLVKVTIMWSELITDPLSILKDLPELTVLVLRRAFLGEEMAFQATGFQKLKTLKLYDMDNLVKLTIESGALPLLELLKIGLIPRFNTVPSDVSHLKKLTALHFYDMPKEFADNLLPDVGQDFRVIKHIKPENVLFNNQGERYTLQDLISNNH